LATLPCQQWNRCIVAVPRHPVLQEKPLTLEAISRYPLITYDDAFTGRSKINKAFLGRGLKPNVVLTALDSDVIKTYVAMDLGIGILARMAWDPAEDRRLGMIDASHLFESSTTRLGLRRNAILRGYVYAFIELFAPQLTRRMVDAALSGAGADDYELSPSEAPGSRMGRQRHAAERVRALRAPPQRQPHARLRGREPASGHRAQFHVEAPVRDEAVAAAGRAHHRHAVEGQAADALAPGVGHAAVARQRQHHAVRAHRTGRLQPFR